MKLGVDNSKYYLGFIFEPDMRDGLHCTHCYFGTLNEASLGKVLDEVGLFFRHFAPVKLAQPVFNMRAMFGPQQDIPVLVSSHVSILELFSPMQRLRNLFRSLGMISTEFPWIPHVTVSPEIDCVSKQIVGYALIKSGGIIVKQWPINEPMPQETAPDIAERYDMSTYKDVPAETALKCPMHGKEGCACG